VGSLLADVRLAVRALGTHRWHAVLVILTVSLGVGANAAIFDVANTLLYRPAPGVRDPGTLVAVEHRGAEGRFPISVPDTATLAAAPALRGLAGFMDVDVLAADLAASGSLPRRVQVEAVTGNYFDVLGVRFALGRGFTDVEGRNPGAAPVCVISDRLYEGMFGRAPAVIGRTVTVDGHRVSIAGVTARGFQGIRLMRHVDVWLPIAQRQLVTPGGPNPAAALANRRSGFFFSLVGRLAPGQTVGILQGQLRTIQAALASAHPADRRLVQRQFTATSGSGVFAGDDQPVRETFTLLLGLSALLFVLACASASNAILARAVSRVSEIQTRLALGASRLAIARMLLAEGLVLVTVACAIALGLSGLVAALLRGTTIAPGLPPIAGASLDWRVVAWAVGLSAFAAIAATLSPLWWARRIGPAWRDDRGRRPGAAGRELLRRGLMAFQIAASVLLLVGAGLLVRSVHAKLAVPPGFDAAGVLTFAVTPQPAPDRPQAVLHRALVDRVHAIPGIQAASVAFTPPFFSNVESRLIFHTDAHPANATVALNFVRPGFFDVLRVPLLAGRDFTEVEMDSPARASSLPLILPESVARRMFPDGDAVGREIITPAGVHRTVVGIVGDSRQRRLVDDNSTDVVYQPFGNGVRAPWVTVVARADGPRGDLWRAIRSAVASVDPTMAVFDATSAEDGIRAEFGGDLLAMRLALAFGGLALLVAAVGLYAILMRRTGERRREFGVRVALGATPARLARLVTREAVVVLSVGVGVGTLAGAWMTRLVASRLYRVSRFDPVSFSAAILFVVAAMLISAVPACYRAITLNPAAALKERE
jgi:predicted permease